MSYYALVAGNVSSDDPTGRHRPPSCLSPFDVQKRLT